MFFRVLFDQNSGIVLRNLAKCARQDNTATLFSHSLFDVFLSAELRFNIGNPHSGSRQKIGQPRFVLLLQQHIG
jgi:hypothetical protein